MRKKLVDIDQISNEFEEKLDHLERSINEELSKIKGEVDKKLWEHKIKKKKIYKEKQH